MKRWMLFFLVALQARASGQQVFHVSDSVPGMSDGLTFGYTITKQTEKEVGNKGDFSRYSLRFFVNNTGSQAKILLHRPGSGLLVSAISPDLVLFRCLNATGARLTPKELTLQARPCIVEAMVEDKDCSSGKVVQNKRPVNIGYWIRPGETISGNTVMIVPLNQRPDITVVLYPLNNTPAATTFIGQ